MPDKLTTNNLNHLGLILDGNRRWAKEQGLPTFDGHKKGYENLKEIAKSAFDLGIKYVSAYAFSTENWNRSADEVDYLMKLLLWVAKNEIKELDKNNIKVVFIGEEDRLSKQVIEAMENAMTRTERNDGGVLVICINYGGQQEITTAVNKILTNNPKIKEINHKMISDNLYRPEIPPIDLIIRTSGEQRLSNFMLWRAAYSELMFNDKYWPAFTKEDLEESIAVYNSRQRRFGK